MNTSSHLEFKELEKLLEPLAVWCVRMGVGHRQFSQLMKDQFFKAACQELSQKNHETVTDSVLCLASGLHRGDVIRIRQAFACNDPAPGSPLNVYRSRINPASQVVARWLALGWSKTIPLRGPEPSFQQLVRGTVLSQSVILKDLQRRQLVQVEDRQVRLLNEVAPLLGVERQNAAEHVVGALRDHLLACMTNLSIRTCDERPAWLEQSLNVDGLHPGPSTCCTPLATSGVKPSRTWPNRP